MTDTVARQATHGQGAGKQGMDLLRRIIVDAGEEDVRQIYERRLLEHAEEVRAERRARLMREAAQ